MPNSRGGKTGQDNWRLGTAGGKIALLHSSDLVDGLLKCTDRADSSFEGFWRRIPLVVVLQRPSCSNTLSVHGLPGHESNSHNISIVDLGSRSEEMLYWAR